MEEKLISRLNLTSWQRRRLRVQLRENPRCPPVSRRTLAVLEFRIWSLRRRHRPHARGSNPAECLRLDRDVHPGPDPFVGARTKKAGGVPRFWTKTKSTCCRPCSPFHLRNSAYPHTSWTVTCFAKPWRSPRSDGCPKILFAGRQVSRMTCGSGRALDLDPEPEREKKTPASAGNIRGSAAAQRCIGSGRDRPAVVPAVAWHLVEARRSRQESG